MKHLLVIAALLLGSTTLIAQEKRYGHLNLGEIVSLMPEAQAADAALRSYQDSLITVGEEMAEAFKLKITAFYQAVEEGTMAPVAQQKRQAALEQEQTSIRTYEQQITQKLGLRRREFLEPVLAKVEQAIQDVAKEKGFVMIFDTSQFNAILFAAEAEDVMPMIKAKLGIK